MSGSRKNRLGHAAILAIAAWLWASAAFAHAVLLGTLPADGTVLAQSPSRVVFQFNEQVVPAGIRVIDASGRLHAGPGGAELQNGTVILSLAKPLPPGNYIASYRVASADTHPVVGSIRFTVGTIAGEMAEVADLVGDPGFWTASSVAVRFVRDAALAVGVGGVFFVLVVARKSAAGRFIKAALWLAAPASLAGAFVAGARLAEHPALFAASFWHATLGLSAVWAAAVILLGVLAAWLALRVESYLLAILGAVLAAVGTALTGHAATGGVDATIAQTLHSLAAFVWIGALVPLLDMAQTGPTAATQTAARRFSALALAIVPMALIGALYLVVQRVSFEQIASAYALLAAAKSVLLGLLLAVAAQNRWRLVPSLVRDAASQSRFVRNLRVDIWLAVALLVITAQLSHTPPPSHSTMHAHAAASGRSVALMREGHQLTVTIDAQTIDLYLAAPDLSALDPIETTLELAQSARGIEALKLPLLRVDRGYFRARIIGFPAHGKWTLRVDALVTDFKKLIFETEIDLGSAGQ